MSSGRTGRSTGARSTPGKAAIVNDILQGVVRIGTGRAAALPDGRPVAGKTGTTENYGDAWFVGYTPQLAVAVWVGYPSELRPMLTEFHGDPVAGGTYPALIWKSFMEKALTALKAAPERLRPAGVHARGVPLDRDAGRAAPGRQRLCRGAHQVLVFYGEAPRKTANCKPNEVQVPKVVGDAASPPPRTSWRRRRSTPEVDLQAGLAGTGPRRDRRDRSRAPARASPRTSRSSSCSPSRSTAWCPKVIGLEVDRADEKLRALELEPEVRGEGRVVAQKPKWGTAAAPGMPITLVARGG